MTLTLIEHGTVVPMTSDPVLIPDGAVLVRDGRIERVGPSAEVRRDLPGDGGPVTAVDATGRLVLPGLVCAHHHLYSTFARGMPLSGFSPRVFPEILEGLWWKLDRALGPGDVRLSALPVLIDGLRLGMTSLIDHHESQGYQDGVLEELAGACREVGVRSVLALGASDRYGRGLAAVAETERFLDGLDGSGLVRGMVGLHASFTVDDATLEAACDVARRRGTGVHVHLAEDPVDQALTLRRYGTSATERLERAGALGPSSLMAHGLHLADVELEILASTRTPLVVNPDSNLNNAVGCPDLLGLRRRGLTVGLGTDGMSSDMRGQLWSLFLLQKHLHRDSRVGMIEAWDALGRVNPGLMSAHAGESLGTLEPGSAADLILLAYDPPTPLTADSLPGHLFFGLVRAPVTMTMVAGRILYREGQYTTVDPVEVHARSREAARALWDRLDRPHPTGTVLRGPRTGEGAPQPGDPMTAGAAEEAPCPSSPSS